MGILFHYISMACTEKYTQYLPLFRFLNEYFLKQSRQKKCSNYLLCLNIKTYRLLDPSTIKIRPGTLI